MEGHSLAPSTLTGPDPGAHLGGIPCVRGAGDRFLQVMSRSFIILKECIRVAADGSVFCWLD